MSLKPAQSSEDFSRWFERKLFLFIKMPFYSPRAGAMKFARRIKPVRNVRGGSCANNDRHAVITGHFGKCFILIWIALKRGASFVAPTPRALDEIFVSFICFCKLIFKEPARKSSLDCAGSCVKKATANLKNIQIFQFQKNDFWIGFGGQKSFF